MKLSSKLYATIRKVRNRGHFARYCGHAPIFAHTGDIGLKVHLGPGPINLQGWINIDARNAPHIHITTDTFSLSEFSDGVIGEIYMCHVLEHFSFEEVDEVLCNLFKKLRVGGVIRLSVPDFDRLVQTYQANASDLELIMFALMGGQDYEYNFHKSVFNRETLTKRLISSGFDDVREWNTEVDFGVHLDDWSERGFQTSKGEFPISLNLKAIKVRG